MRQKARVFCPCLKILHQVRVVRMTIVSDTPSGGITYDCHSDDSRGVIYTPPDLILMLPLK
jgi:hypothetical protein